MKRIPIAVFAILLCVSAALAWWALASPVRTLVFPPAMACDPEAQVGRNLPAPCTAAAARYVAGVETAVIALRPFQTYAEIAEGLLIAAVMFLILPWLRSPILLRKGFSLPLPFRLAVGAIGAAGWGVFAYGEASSILFAETGNRAYLNLFDADPQMALHAALGLAAASACFGLLRSNRSLSFGVRSGVFFGAIWVLFVQLCIYLFDPSEMAFHVADFAYWEWANVYLMGNWVVMIVSAALLALVLSGGSGWTVRQGGMDSRIESIAAQ